MDLIWTWQEINKWRGRTNLSNEDIISNDSSDIWNFNVEQKKREQYAAPQEIWSSYCAPDEKNIIQFFRTNFQVLGFCETIFYLTEILPAYGRLTWECQIFEHLCFERGWMREPSSGMTGEYITSRWCSKLELEIEIEHIYLKFENLEISSWNSDHFISMNLMGGMDNKIGRKHRHSLVCHTCLYTTRDSHSERSLGIV